MVWIDGRPVSVTPMMIRKKDSRKSRLSVRKVKGCTLSRELLPPRPHAQNDNEVHTRTLIECVVTPRPTGRGPALVRFEYSFWVCVGSTPAREHTTTFSLCARERRAPAHAYLSRRTALNMMKLHYGRGRRPIPDRDNNQLAFLRTLFY